MTIRLSDEQDKALSNRARALRRTRSQLVRELIDRGLDDQPIGRRAGDLRGRLELPSARSGWRRQIKDRNWR